MMVGLALDLVCTHLFCYLKVYGQKYFLKAAVFSSMFSESSAAKSAASAAKSSNLHDLRDGQHITFLQAKPE